MDCESVKAVASLSSTSDDLNEIKGIKEDERKSVKAIDLTLQIPISKNNTEDDTTMMSIKEGDNTLHSDRSDNVITFNLPNKNEEAANSLDNDIRQHEFMKELNLINQEKNKRLEIVDHKNELQKDDDGETLISSNLSVLEMERLLDESYLDDDTLYLSTSSFK